LQHISPVSQSAGAESWTYAPDSDCEALQNLACPTSRSREIANEIVRSYAAEIASIALDHGAISNPDFAQFFQDGIAAIDGLGVGWDHGFGVAHDAIVANKRNDAGLVEIALHFSASGVRGRWTATLTQPRKWRFANLLLPPTDHLCVETADGMTLVATDTSSPPVRLEGSGMNWRFTDEASASTAGYAGLDQVCFGQPHPSAALCPGLGLFKYEGFVDPTLLSGPLPTWLRDTVEEATTQLAAAAPVYLDWVNDVVRVLTPCLAKPGTLSSGSSSRMLGVIRFTADPRPEALVEMLVHEATHQYLYVGGLVDNLADPEDTRLFWSPVKNKGRTIDKILLAYHAFANVEAVFASCLSAGIGDGNYYAPQFERLVAHLDLMEGHLLGATSALTPAGRALCEPLIARRRRQ
jgi:hypothetical protein